MRKLNTLDKVLLICLGLIIVFTVTMIIIFCVKDSVPDTLIVAFFGLFTGEGLFCWRIWDKKRKTNNVEDNNAPDEVTP